MWWNDLNIAKLKWWYIISPLISQPRNVHLRGAEGWHLPSASEQPTLTLLSVYSLQFYSGHYEAAQVTPCRLIRGCLEFYSGTVMPHPPGHHRKDTPSSGLAHSWFQSSCLKVLFYISNSVKGQLFYQISQLLYPYPPPRPPSAARQQLLPAAVLCVSCNLNFHVCL